MIRASTASAQVIENTQVLQTGMENARRLWNETWWCAVGYNRKLRQRRGDFFKPMKGRLPKYPGNFGMQKELTDFWAWRNLSDRCASYTVKDFDIAMKSWFSNLKGNPDARPPRPCKEPRTLTFEVGRNAKHIGEWHYRLTVLGGHIKDRHCVVKIHVRPGVKVADIRMIRIAPEVIKGRYQVSLVGEREAKAEGGTGYAAIDLGIVNIGALAIDTGETVLYSGKALLDVARQGEKKAAQCKAAGYAVDGWDRLPASKRNKAYRATSNNTIDLAIHNFTTDVIRQCAARGVGVLAVGDLTGIREDKDFGSKTNQKLHRWPFRKITEQLKWKGEEYNIEVVQVSEAYTSRTCSACGCVRKANRVERGLYKCSDCSTMINADINGAINILKKVSPSAIAVGVEAIFPSLPSTGSQQGTGEVITFSSQPTIVAKFDLSNYQVVTVRNTGATL
jgi:putative transposase